MLSVSKELPELAGLKAQTVQKPMPRVINNGFKRASRTSWIESADRDGIWGDIFDDVSKELPELAGLKAHFSGKYSLKLASFCFKRASRTSWIESSLMKMRHKL